MTVCGETWSTSAVSSTLSPPKNRSSMTCARRGSMRVRLSRASSSAQSDEAFDVDGRNLIEVDCRRVLDPRRPAAPLRRRPRPRGVDEDAPHELRRQREEVHAIVPVDVLGVDQT